MSLYPADMTLREARAQFFARSGLGREGGYSDRWVRVEARPFPFYFPNSRARVRAAKLHDLHHIALDYQTDWPGEAEIAAWEIASGCGHYIWAWLLNLGAFTVGMALFPRRLFRAFIRGRHCANLYREGFPESELATKSVSWLRDRCRISGDESKASASDKLAFVCWGLVAIGYHAAFLIVPLAILWGIVKHLVI